MIRIFIERYERIKGVSKLSDNTFCLEFMNTFKIYFFSEKFSRRKKYGLESEVNKFVRKKNQ